MFITVTTTYHPFTSFEVNLTSPVTGQLETLELILYSQCVETWMARNTRKKPTGVYRSTATGEDIPAAYWTDEMERFYKERAAACTPVPNAGYRFTLGGKIMIGLSIAFVLFVIGGLVKVMTFDRWAKAAATEEVTKAPISGDEYCIGLPVKVYGDDGNPVAAGDSYTWCRVVGSEPDGALRLKITEPLKKGEELEADFAKELSEDGTFVADFHIEAATSKGSYPKIYFQSRGSNKRLSVFFFGTVDRAKRPAN